MKAIVQPRYGSPDVLRLEEISKPGIKDDEVLVRVRAAAVNIGDWHLLRGVPYVMRLVFGLRGPRRRTPGLDIAGQVEAVAGNVKQIRRGAERYDVMLDLVGTSRLSDCRRVLTPRGTYVLVGVKDMGRWFGLGRQCKTLMLSPAVGQRLRVFVARHTRDELAFLKEVVETGKVAPVIDRRYSLSDTPEALRYQGEGHARGKIVIVV